MPTSHTFILRIRLAWWARLHIESVIIFAGLTGFEPDEDKLARIMRRGLKTEVIPSPRNADITPQTST